MLFNNTDVRGNFLAGSGGSSGLAGVYDSKRGELFIGSGGAAGISVVSDVSDEVVATIPVPSNPTGLAYDPSLGEIFEAGGGSTAVSVISSTNDSVIATIELPGTVHHYGLAYASATDELFVSNPLAGNVSVISTNTDKEIRAITVGEYSEGLTYDSAKREVFVDNVLSSNVSVISVTNNSVVASIPVASLSPSGQLVYDKAKGEIFVATNLDVDVISDRNNSVIAKIPLEPGPGSGSGGIAYDSSRNEVFVTPSGCGNPCVGNISVISTKTDTVVSTIPLTIGEMAVYDPARGEVFFDSGFQSIAAVSDSSDSVVASIELGAEPDYLAYAPNLRELFEGSAISNTLDVISGTTNKIVSTITLGGEPGALMYDQNRSELFVSELLSVEVIDARNGSMVASIPIQLPSGLAYDSGLGEVFITSCGSSCALASGKVFILSAATNDVLANVSVGSYPISLAYDPAQGEVFVANYGSSNISVISDSTDKITNTIALGESPLAESYVSAKKELFVETDTGRIAIVSCKTNSVTSNLTGGTGPDEPGGLAYDSHAGKIFSANFGSGNVSVISDSSDKIIEWIAVGTAPESLAVNGSGDAVYVANSLQGTISIVHVPTSGSASTRTDVARARLVTETQLCAKLAIGEPVNRTSPHSTVSFGTSSPQFGSVENAHRGLLARHRQQALVKGIVESSPTAGKVARASVVGRA